MMIGSYLCGLAHCEDAEDACCGKERHGDDEPDTPCEPHCRRPQLGPNPHFTVREADAEPSARATTP
jgi:hypothetical protein